MFALGDLHEASVDESTVAADFVLPIIEVVFVTDKGQFGFGSEIVVHADESAGVTGRARGADIPFENGNFKSALSKMEGDTGAHHACTNDDGIVGLCHSWFLFSLIITDESSKKIGEIRVICGWEFDWEIVAGFINLGDMVCPCDVLGRS